MPLAEERNEVGAEEGKGRKEGEKGLFERRSTIDL